VCIYIYGLRWVHGGNVERQRSWVLILVIGHLFFFSFWGKCTVDCCWEGRVIMSHFERRCNGFERELHVGVVNVGDLISSSFGEEFLL
jgi:hypothetical protein